MPCSLESKVIKHKITNDDVKDSNCDNFEIANHDIYAYPYYHHHYHVELIDLKMNLYVMNAKPLKGLFKNITFTKGSFLDCSIFRNVTFENCIFEDVQIRWTRFENCKFINCKGNISYARKATWTKGCEFIDTEIRIDSIDQFIYFKGNRGRNYYGEKFVVK